MVVTESRTRGRRSGFPTPGVEGLSLPPQEAKTTPWGPRSLYPGEQETPPAPHPDPGGCPGTRYPPLSLETPAALQLGLAGVHWRERAVFFRKFLVHSIHQSPGFSIYCLASPRGAWGGLWRVLEVEGWNFPKTRGVSAGESPKQRLKWYRRPPLPRRKPCREAPKSGSPDRPPERRKAEK